MGETDVEIHSRAQIVFENGFVSNVNTSFKENLGNDTIIKGTLGKIYIHNTFLGIDQIRVILKNDRYDIKKKNKENIYSIEIENISQNILDKQRKILFPGVQIDETFLNMKILESWKNG